VLARLSLCLFFVAEKNNRWLVSQTKKTFGELCLLVERMGLMLCNPVAAGNYNQKPPLSLSCGCVRVCVCGCAKCVWLKHHTHNALFHTHTNTRLWERELASAPWLAWHLDRGGDRLYLSICRGNTIFQSQKTSEACSIGECVGGAIWSLFRLAIRPRHCLLSQW